MKLDLQECELCLVDNVPLRLSRARGLTVCCTAGRVWLTVDGEAGDIILRAGQRHRLQCDGLALLEAVGSGRVRLVPMPAAMNIRAAGLSRLSHEWREIFHFRAFARLINCIRRFLPQHQAERRTWHPLTIDAP